MGFRHATELGTLHLSPFGNLWLPAPRCTHPAEREPCPCWTTEPHAHTTDDPAANPLTDSELRGTPDINPDSIDWDNIPLLAPVHDPDTGDNYEAHDYDDEDEDAYYEDEGEDEDAYYEDDEDDDADAEDEGEGSACENCDECGWLLDLSDPVGLAVGGLAGTPVFWVQHPDCPGCNGPDCGQCRQVNIAAWAPLLDTDSLEQARHATNDALTQAVEHLRAAEAAAVGTITDHACAGCLANWKAHRATLRHVVIELAEALCDITTRQHHVTQRTTEPTT